MCRQISSPVNVRSAPCKTLLAVDVLPVETGMPANSMHAGRTHRGQTPHPPLFSPLLFPAVHASSPAIRAVRARRWWAAGAFGPGTRVPPSPIRGSPRRLCRSAAGARRPPCRRPAGGGSHPSRETVGRHLLDQRVRNATEGTPRRSSSEAHNAHAPSSDAPADGEDAADNVASTSTDRCMTRCRS